MRFRKGKWRKCKMIPDPIVLKRLVELPRMAEGDDWSHFVDPVDGWVHAYDGWKDQWYSLAFPADSLREIP